MILSKKPFEFLREGVHVLIVDLFPPTLCDPYGMHKLIWDGFLEEDFTFPPGKDRIVASYDPARKCQLSSNR